MKFWEKLKVKWEVESDLRMVKIWIVFAITGSASAFLRRQIFDWLGIAPFDPHWVWIVFKFAFILGVFYPVTLVVVGTLFGEPRFFGRFMVKIYKGYGKLFSLPFRLISK